MGMTENKRFTLHIGWYNYEKTEGEAVLKDNGQPILESECIHDMRCLKELLNEQHEENQRLKEQVKLLKEDLGLLDLELQEMEDME